MRKHDAPSPPRVALVFFGLFRAPSQTLDSVTRHVIAPLRRAGALVEVYLHSYNDTRRLHNPRVGEHNLTWRFDRERRVSLTGRSHLSQRKGPVCSAKTL